VSRLLLLQKSTKLLYPTLSNLSAEIVDGLNLLFAVAGAPDRKRLVGANDEKLAPSLALLN
jgi:hypothetical protein